MYWKDHELAHNSGYENGLSTDVFHKKSNKKYPQYGAIEKAT